MFAPGAIDDFSTTNPLSFQMVNLQVAAFPIFQSRTLAQAAAVLAFLTLFAIWLFATLRDGHLALSDLAFLAAASLLPVYHRFMDAGLLLIPVVWAFSELRTSKIFATVCLLLMCPFLAPGATILHEFSEEYAPVWQLSHSRVWDGFILPHEAWLILLLSIVLVIARCRPETLSAGE
jgi:hypothetical protein